jgi:alanine dehydrogenase
LVSTAADIFASADLIVKVKEPLPEECAMLRPHHVIFTYLHLAAAKKMTDALCASGCTAIGYETIEVNHRLPLLEPMSELAGRMSVIVGADLLSKNKGGPGILLSGVPGVMPGQVLILGGGSAGFGAALIAKGLGARVIVLEVNSLRIHELTAQLPGVHVVQSSSAALEEYLPQTDLFIGAVLIAGAKAPKLINEKMISLMRPGSVFIDIAIDQGGCSTTSHPTTHEDPTYVESGVTHYCVTNMPAAYARTSTMALTNATFPYVFALANEGVASACKKYPELGDGINVQGGNLIHPAVIAALL